MSDSKKNAPKRRFEEFSNANAWEQRELGEVVQITMGQSPNGTNYTENPNDYILVQGNADMKNGQVVPRIWTKQITKTAAIGDIILSVRAPVGDVGKTNYNVVLGRGVAGIKGDEFIYQVLFKMRLENYWAKYSTGSTFESINSNDLKEAKMFVPKELEKKEIGIFFKQLDNTIALHQRKLEKIKALKIAYLSEMFPAEGESKPKRRFAGFTDDWEQRKLGEITLSYSGGTPLVSKSEYYGDDIPFIRSAEINSDSTELCLTKVGLKNSSAKLVKAGDILYALYGATSGETGISRINGAINQAILAIHPMKGYESQFLVQWLRYQKKKIISRYIQGGQGNLSSTIIKNLDIKLPSLKEQIKIGTFFLELDNTITLHQRKLQKLQNIKKAYLNEMFI
ncbi:restriction endonuclease subunit S [Listeria ivanovii]|uniref:restriction endonuclease subunit S n=1 Tax=Listeria ivanovii TaxID=1638 RepID=UPI001624FACF|nr:restriction endonuclease subunit S [Listeria ivanovii]MBC2254391.1 restriction endonuclease subunit S [Listeria ivanovii]